MAEQTEHLKKLACQSLSSGVIEDITESVGSYLRLEKAAIANSPKQRASVKGGRFAGPVRWCFDFPGLHSSAWIT